MALPKLLRSMKAFIKEFYMLRRCLGSCNPSLVKTLLIRIAPLNL